MGVRDDGHVISSCAPAIEVKWAILNKRVSSRHGRIRPSLRSDISKLLLNYGLRLGGLLKMRRHYRWKPASDACVTNASALARPHLVSCPDSDPARTVPGTLLGWISKPRLLVPLWGRKGSLRRPI